MLRPPSPLILRRRPFRPVPPPAATALFVCLFAFCFLTGCTSSTKPGDLSRVQVSSTAPRAGNVYLLRGWIGIFSAGIDQLGQKLNDAGMRASVYQEDQWHALGEEILKRYAPSKNALASAAPGVGAAPPEPLILVGHSYGADSVVRIAQMLKEKNIKVDLLVTLDPVTPPKVPSNVVRTYNLYQSNGVLDQLPWLRGIPLVADADNKNELLNLDIRKDRTDLLAKDLDHFNIEKQPLVHHDVVLHVEQVCPPRTAWLATIRSLPVKPVPGATTRGVNASVVPSTRRTDVPPTRPSAVSASRGGGASQ